MLGVHSERGFATAAVGVALVVKAANARFMHHVLSKGHRGAPASRPVPAAPSGARPCPERYDHGRLRFEAARQLPQIFAVELLHVEFSHRLYLSNVATRRPHGRSPRTA